MKNKYKLWIILSLILFFAAGVAGGIFLEKYVISKKPERQRRSPARFPSLETMTTELSLTEEQQASIKEMFRKNEERLKEMRSSIHKNLGDLRTQLMSEIKNILTPEQRDKFEAMVKRYLDERKKELEDREKNMKRPPQNSKEGERR